MSYPQEVPGILEALKDQNAQRVCMRVARDLPEPILRKFNLILFNEMIDHYVRYAEYQNVALPEFFHEVQTYDGVQTINKRRIRRLAKNFTHHYYNPQLRLIANACLGLILHNIKKSYRGVSDNAITYWHLGVPVSHAGKNYSKISGTPNQSLRMQEVIRQTQILIPLVESHLDQSVSQWWASQAEEALFE